MLVEAEKFRLIDEMVAERGSKMKAYSLHNTDYDDCKECVCCAAMSGLRWERKITV